MEKPGEKRKSGEDLQWERVHGSLCIKKLAEAIKDLNSGKAHGSDGVSIEL